MRRGHRPRLQSETAVLLLLFGNSDKDNVGVLFNSAEDDFSAIRGNVEVIDNEFAAKVRELTLLSTNKVNQPEILVPNVALQDEETLSGYKGKAVCASR